MAHVLASELRESVYIAAISGKLTTQNPDDLSAFELLESLKRKKEELVKSKSIYKKKPTDPLYTKDQLDELNIPDNWCFAQLSDVSLIQEGAGIRKWQYRDNGVQLLCVTNILDGQVDLNKKHLYISKEEYEEKYKHLTVNKGDIVSSCSGGSWGKTSFYNLDDIIMMNTSTLRLRFFGDLANNNYLYMITKSNWFKKQLQDQLSGMQPNFGYAHYSRIMLPLPPIEEQARIVARVDELMAKIDEYEKLENELVELKKNFPGDMKAAVLQAAMQGKLTEQLKSDSNITLQKCNYPDEDAIPFDIPESWMWCSLKNVANNIGGFAFKSTNFTEKGTRVIRISDFNELGLVNNKIVRYEYNDKLSNYLIQNQDILMCMTGGTVGKNYYVQDLKEDCLLNQRVACIRAKNVDSEYLNLVIKSPFVQQLIVNNKNSTNDNISMDLINNFPIPLPPIEEQQRIVEKLDKLLPLCDALCEGLYGR